jgi:HEPN domain-containing protein
MKPFAIYHLFTDGFLSLVQPLTDRIVPVARPDRIFLLGASLHRRRTESIFNQTAPGSRYISDCTVLVLIPDLAGKGIYEWENIIEDSCKKLMPVTVIAVQTRTFEEWMKAGDSFACSVCESAVTIYGSKKLTATVTVSGFKMHMNTADDRFYKNGMIKSAEFLTGSELFRIRKQYAISAFMLHQSAEQALYTLIKIGTGYEANTHNLERLLRYAGLVSYQIPDIFPRKTDREKQLFLLLQRAYVDSRYKSEYKICIEDLLYLTDKIRHIHEILSGYRQQQQSA